MLSKIRHIDFYPDEFLTGVSGKLTPEQTGVYWTICSLIYSNGGPIDNDPSWLGNIMRGTHWRTVKRIIKELVKMGKVESKSGSLMVQRCRKELARTEQRIGKARASGLQGGRPYKENNDLTKPDGLFCEKLTTNYQLPTTNYHSVSKDTVTEATKVDPPESIKTTSHDDTIKTIFDTGVALLTKTGHSEKQARSLVGKWRKSAGDEKLAGLLVSAAAKTNPVEWIMKSVEPKRRRRL